MRADKAPKGSTASPPQLGSSSASAVRQPSQSRIRAASGVSVPPFSRPRPRAPRTCRVAALHKATGFALADGAQAFASNNSPPQHIKDRRRAHCGACAKNPQHGAIESVECGFQHLRRHSGGER